jgi:hypothetical protein
MSNQLTVADVTVRQDDAGRYNLNDLHKAAGGAERHATWRFIRSDKADALIDQLISEIQNTNSGGLNPVFRKRGRHGGTFVVKELVYAYAMWISPKFHLKVIRAYDSFSLKAWQYPKVPLVICSHLSLSPVLTFSSPATYIPSLRIAGRTILVTQS